MMAMVNGNNNGDGDGNSDGHGCDYGKKTSSSKGYWYIVQWTLTVC